MTLLPRYLTLALGPALIILVCMLGVFSLDMGQGDAPLPWGFILTMTGLTLVVGLVCAVTDWLEHKACTCH